MIVNGDISYARGWPWIWERYFDLIQPLATMMPWMVRDEDGGVGDDDDAACGWLSFCLQVGVGNHEIDTHENDFHSARGNDSGGECGVATLKRFPQFPSLKQMWYAIQGRGGEASA